MTFSLRFLVVAVVVVNETVLCSPPKSILSGLSSQQYVHSNTSQCSPRDKQACMRAAHWP